MTMVMHIAHRDDTDAPYGEPVSHALWAIVALVLECAEDVFGHGPDALFAEAREVDGHPILCWTGLYEAGWAALGATVLALLVPTKT